MSKQLLEKQNIDFAEGENTYGLEVWREKWRDGNGKELVYWKYGLPDGVQIVALTPTQELIVIREEKNGIEYIHCVGETMEEWELPATHATILQATSRGLLEETGYQAGSLELLSSVLENSGKSDRLIHHVLAQNCTQISEPEENVCIHLYYPPLHFYNILLKYFLKEPFSKHPGGNTLQALTLAFHKLGLIP